VNALQIQRFVMRYLDAECCEIIEKHPAYVTVKLSPSADKDLTNRPYYWSFVERTGAVPETVTYTFVFDPEKANELLAAGNSPSHGRGTVMPGAALSGGVQPGPARQGNSTAATLQQAQSGQPDTILGRYFGFVPTTVTARIPKDNVTYGSRRLEQIFAAVKAKGKYVKLFEEPPQGQRSSSASLAYDTWFHANYKVELACDMKRSEIHSLAIRLATGEIREQFHDLLIQKRLTPRLPANIHIIPDKMSLSHGAGVLERYLENKLKQYDHQWAEEAHDRLMEELARIRVYYEGLIKAVEPDKQPEIEAQYRNRHAEIEWQYQPRVNVSVINCGLFHLHSAYQP
jgi:hypothetical protein